VLRILAGSTVLQFPGRGAGQIEGVVEFAIGQESGIAGDLGPEEAEPETAVELGSQRLGRAVTHEVGSTNGQEVVGNPGIWRVPAQLSYRFRLLIWEIRA
jgi:hypothetical protein